MPAGRPRVLYIDDDPGLGRLVQKALAKHDFDVEHALSGTIGLKRLVTERFDAVALDHHMPGQTGLQVLSQIQGLHSPPPVVYVTGSEDSHIAVAALKAGAADYVWKDVQGHFRELLAEALKTALGKARLQREKQEAEREMRAAKDRAELLLKEVNHRVANSLTIVASLVSLQRNRMEDPSVREVLDQMRARITAIAAIHRKLYTSDDVTSVELREYLKQLIAELSVTQVGDRAARPITLDCVAITLPTDKAVSLGIAVTELLTNAIKYAYPNGGPGEIRVRVLADATEGRLIVEDDGVGIASDSPGGTGLGSKIVASMAASLGGSPQVSNANPGVRASITFPLPAPPPEQPLTS